MKDLLLVFSQCLELYINLNLFSFSTVFYFWNQIGIIRDIIVFIIIIITTMIIRILS